MHHRDSVVQVDAVQWLAGAGVETGLGLLFDQLRLLALGRHENGLKLRQAGGHTGHAGVGVVAASQPSQQSH
jgi:hypothetical protein